MQPFQPITTRARVIVWLHFNVFRLGAEISATNVGRDNRLVKYMTNILYLDLMASFFLMSSIAR